MARLSEEQRTYLRFGAMIVTSMVVMFVIMYLNTYELAHVQWSETRFFMTWVMGAAMAVVIEAQRREIAEMEWLIADIEENSIASTEEEAAERPVPEFDAEP